MTKPSKSKSKSKSDFQSQVLSFLTSASTDLIHAFFHSDIDTGQMADYYITSNFDYEDGETPGFDELECQVDYVKSFGGEGQGDNYWSVYRFTKKNTGEEVYIRFEGYYASYIGAEFREFLVVKPTVKTITVYE